MWDFFEHQPGRTLVDPIEEAFFSTDTDEENTRHLVRESIQNSLDARHNQETVRVRFTFGQLEDEHVGELFSGLKDHLEAQGSGLQSPPSLTSGMRFMAIEDFGTTGLTGDPAQLTDSDSDDEDNFFYFWRNVGRSGKRTGTLGKWGLGKTVFPASSRINTFFGITRRHGDVHTYLLGRCDIKSHRIEGLQYDPYGYFADWDGEKPMAISERGRIARVRDAFHLARSGENDTPGLSIVIPHVVGEFDVAMLRQEVVENYFWPILKNDLVIEVQENYLTPPETVIDADWLRGITQMSRASDFERELVDTIRLADWASSNLETTARVSATQSSKSPKWDEMAFSDADMERLTQADQEREPLSIRANIRVEPRTGQAQTASFNIYCQRVLYPTRRKSYLVRQGINVGNACSVNPRNRIFLVVVNDGLLAELMGDGENPSHTSFERTEVVKQRYKRGAMARIDFARYAPSGISRWLEQRQDDEETGLFGDVFWKVPTIAESTNGRRRRTRRQRTRLQGGLEGPIERTPKSFSLDRTDDGFVLRDSGERQRELESVTIVAGFEGGRGDPFKSHSKFDFDFRNPESSGLSIDPVKCRVEPIDANRLRLMDVSNDFSVRITGFDTKRDLRVNATPRLIRQ